MRKQPKPTNNKGSIQIRFRLNGNDHVLMGYGSYNDKKAIALAQAFASKLYGDYLSGNLKDLSEYTPKIKATSAKKSQPESFNLGMIYNAYKAYKAAKVCAKTLEIYEMVATILGKINIFSHKIHSKQLIKIAITTTQTPYIAKLVCQHLEAASKWAYSNELIDKHYLENLGHDLATGRNKPESKPFSAKQKWDICVAFYDHDKYTHYHGFVNFLFETGCRPCEAIGLEWQDIDLGKKQIRLGRSSVKLKDGTQQDRAVSKNGGIRIFPMNQSLIRLFQHYQQTLHNFDTKVFVNPEGNSINLQNFRRNAWAKVLNELGIDSSRHSVYSTRDTFITLALEQGIDVRTIAKLCDNSPQIIYKHYAGWTKDIQAIEFN